MVPNLHPNLALIASQYDDIIRKWQLGQLTEVEAKRQLGSLVARDDSGVQWTINPTDAQWYRRTRTGSLVQDTPPSSGISTLTGWDVSGSSSNVVDDPRRRVVSEEIELPAVSTGLSGATQRVANSSVEDTTSTEGRALFFVLSVVALFVLLLIFLAVT